MRQASFHGGPLDGQLITIESEDQQVFHCWVNLGDWVSKHTYRERFTNRLAFDHHCAEYRFVVETDQPDEQGTVVNLQGIETRDTLPVCMNFSRNIQDVVGHAKVWVNNGNLWCQAELREDHIDLYPAIGFEVIKWEDRPTGKYYDQVKLFQIGLSATENTNPTIKTIREQQSQQP